MRFSKIYFLFCISFSVFVGAEKKMGIEIETSKIKVKNNTDYNLTLFTVLNPTAVWTLETDTVDIAARAARVHNAVNLEAKTFGGWGKEQIRDITREIVEFLGNFVTWTEASGYAPCEVAFRNPGTDWPVPKSRHITVKKIIEKWAQETGVTVTKVTTKNDICRMDGKYMPQVSIQFPLKDFLAILQKPAIISHSRIEGFVTAFSSVTGEKSEVEAVSGDASTRGFLTLLFFIRRMAFNHGDRGGERAEGGENGVKYALSLMPRVDLKVLFKLLPRSEQEKIISFLTPQYATFRNYKIRHYLSMAGKKVEDGQTFEDYVRYIIGGAIGGQPNFYEHSSSIVEMDKQVKTISGRLGYPIVIMEYRGFRVVLDSPITLVTIRESISAFADEFFAD